jgi:hypothetical protein
MNGEMFQVYESNKSSDISSLFFLSYRQMPTFGSSTIRKFSNNASEMKKLAARDFEDLLQVETVTRVVSIF